MTPAALSLVALLAAIVLSCTSRINVGLLAMALAWGIGVYAAGLRPDAVVAGFPTSLFVTLVGVTLLFSAAQANGALAALAERAVRLVGGRRDLLPPLVFVLSFLLSAIGPGAIAGVALVAPLAVPIGRRAGVSAFLMSIMVGTGANAGNLSPVSAVGIIADTSLAKVGLGGHELKVWAAGFLAHLLVAAVAYAVLGARHSALGTRPLATPSPSAECRVPSAELTARHWLTIAVTVAWIAGVVLLKLHLGLGAVAAATLLVLAGAADERETVRAVPWGVILMVCGVTMLIALLERTGGMTLFTGLLARLATPATLNGVIAFVTGVVSTYSSTSGVVLPAFLPTVPGLVQQVGGGDPVAVALSITVGSALVDVSPLSTLGALCVAAVHDHDEAQALFRKLLIWGLSMTVVGAVLCQLAAGWFARL